MRQIFFLGHEHLGDVEILYVFGTTWPTRAEVAKYAADYPQANVFATAPDNEEKILNTRILYRLSKAANRWQDGD